jgi:transposase InsO family protein
MGNLTSAILTSEMALPLVSIFETLALSRATYYRHLVSSLPADPDMELRDHIQRLALQWPQYGYRRIAAELHRQGVAANHKRVLRLMHEDNLLCLRKRRFILTTDSRHSLTIYPNLVPELTLTSINQLWVAEEVYLFEYETMAEARARISHFLEEVYNQKRLHSAIGYLPPAEYEQQLCQTTDA